MIEYETPPEKGDNRVVLFKLWLIWLCGGIMGCVFWNYVINKAVGETLPDGGVLFLLAVTIVICGIIISSLRLWTQFKFARNWHIVILLAFLSGSWIVFWGMIGMIHRY